MSDNDDLLGDDLGDQSLADYNLGNEEEEQLLADDYDSTASQNVPPSIDPRFESNTIPDYGNQSEAYTSADTECVVPNIVVEVPNVCVPHSLNILPEHSNYGPYQPPRYEMENAVVPPAIPAGPIESPQIVPSEVLLPHMNNGDVSAERERFITERPPNMRMPQVRYIPDSLDKVVCRGGGGASRGGRGRTSWRNPQYNARFNHPYRRHHMQRGPFPPRPSFPPPMQQEQLAPELPPQMAPPPQLPPDLPPSGPFRHEPHRPIFPNQPRFQNFHPNRPPFQYRQPYRPFVQVPLPPMTIRQPMMSKMEEFPGKLAGREPEVRMLPVLPPSLPPGGPTGKIVLINPHFKGNFQPPEGPIKDIDDAAERFIAEQQSALARARTQRNNRRSPQRFIENTTIEIENDLARSADSSEADLLRRQEEFINANRAGLRRRMRSPSPPRRSPPRRSPSPSPSPPAPSAPSAPSAPRRRSPPRRADTHAHDEDSEYRRRLREQENLRERVLRAKEVRRRKNAVVLQKQIQDRQRQDKDPQKPEAEKDRTTDAPEKEKDKKPEPKLERDRSPTKTTENTENLTPPRENLPKVVEKQTVVVEKPTVVVEKSPERNLTPPLPVTEKKKEERKMDSDPDLDDLDLILDDIDGILSDDDDSGRFKEKTKKTEPPPKQKPSDLRHKLPPKNSGDSSRPPKQRIVFGERRDERKKEKTPPPTKKSLTTKTENNENIEKKVLSKTKQESELSSKMRQRIIFDSKEKEKPTEVAEEPKPQPFQRRVVLQRKITAKTDKADKSVFSRIEIKTDPSKPNPGIFSRAVRTAIGAEKPRVVVKKQEEPQIEFEIESDLEDSLLSDNQGNIAEVTNLPHGMTDTRLKTLAGGDVQSVNLDKEERSAKLTFKNAAAAETFKRKFNNKMVAASRLNVTLC